MNLFMLRLPQSRLIIAGASERILPASGFRPAGATSAPDEFIFAPFCLDPEVKAIPRDLTEMSPEQTDAAIAANDAEFARNHPIPESGTPRATHLDVVRRIRERVVELERLSGRHAKTIAARTAIAEGTPLPTEIFRRLCRRYPDACAFLFSTPFTGTWTGASPELLLDVDQEGFGSVALAGTRARSADGSPTEDWDAKNTEEQAIVTEFILDEMRAEGLNPNAKPPITRRAGPVEHLCTSIYAKSHNHGVPDLRSTGIRLLRRLSPTPALSGFPRKEAMEAIVREEGFEREYYGGFVGILSPPSGRLTAYVNLRSCRCDSIARRALLFAGGGITRASRPEEEWTETERKLSTLLSVIE